MKNPLRKRLPRELWADKGKYIALFIFQAVLVGLISGFLVADISLKTAYDESFEKYNVEDGHFRLYDEAEQSMLDKLDEKQDITVYDLQYKDKTWNDTTVRVYKVREDVNRADLLEGKMPESKGDIVIDRLYAENNGIEIGDVMTLSGTDFTVCGFVAFSDYSALFKSNTDMMFDATGFTVAAVTEKAYNALNDSGIEYCYAWCNNDRTLDEQQAYDKGQDILEYLSNNATPTDFVLRSENQAIVFTGEDMGNDKAMITVMLYIIIALLAFSFAFTTKSMIEQESGTIGTLLASGYTKRELMRHYMTLPILINLAAALVGNIAGYTVMKDCIASVYYGSYSLPTYHTVWSSEAFWTTTVGPAVIILVINWFTLTRALSLPPIQFLRHELKRKKKKRVIRLSPFKFITRFRLRIIFQNLPAYITLAIGIWFATFMLMFGLGMQPLLNHFKVDALSSKIANYQYVLKTTTEEVDEDEYELGTWLAPYMKVFRYSADTLEIEDAPYLVGFDTETDYEGAEKYCISSLQLPDGGEEISVYGVQDNSAYIKNIDFSGKDGGVYISDSYMQKYHLNIGDTITLEEKYDDKSYTFTIEGEYPYAASLVVFMPIDQFRTTFGLTADSFSGYLSDKELTDIDEEGIATCITEKDLTVVADQLIDSMGSMMYIVDIAAALIYLIVLYLLSKMIVDKNAQSISMVKILGYDDREISSLYNTVTAIVVGISLLGSLPLCAWMFKVILEYYMVSMMNGWLNFWLPTWCYVMMVVIGVMCYAFVHMLQMRRIRRIPLSQALKNVE